jgi:hypothetical protein
MGRETTSDNSACVLGSRTMQKMAPDSSDHHSPFTIGYELERWSGAILSPEKSARKPASRPRVRGCDSK